MRARFDFLFLLLGLLLVALLPARASADNQVDLQLVLAADASYSVDDREFALQMQGIARAFRDPEVQAAIIGGARGRIAVALMIWAESNRRKQITPWQVLDSPASAEAFAAMVAGLPRPFDGGTGIGRAIMQAVWLLEKSGFESPRRVIDVSGDGRETTFREWSVTPAQAHVAAARRGITVNGLAVLSEEPDLARYYRENVIGGPGAFVMVARRIEDFAGAMRLKLIREIKGEVFLGRKAPPAQARPDSG